MSVPLCALPRLCISVSLCHGLPVLSPPHPLPRPSNPGVSQLAATLSGSPCSRSLGLCVLSPGSLCSLPGLCVLSPGLSVLSPGVFSLFPGLSVLPPPSLGLPSRVSVVSLAGLLVSLSPTDWSLCRPSAGWPPHRFSGMLPLWFFHPRVGEGQFFFRFQHPPHPQCRAPSWSRLVGGSLVPV